MSINAKLLAGFLAIAALTMIVGGVGFFGIDKIAEEQSYATQTRVPDLMALQSLNTERMSIRAQTLDVWTEENAEQQVAVDAYRRIQEQRNQSWEVVDAAWALALQTPRHGPNSEQLMEALKEAYQVWRGHYKDLDRLLDGFVNSQNDLQRASLYRQYRAASNRMIPDSEQMGGLLDDLIEAEIEYFNRTSDESVELAHLLETVMLVVTIIGVLAAIALGLLLNQNISGPLKRVSTLLATVAKGDFSVDVDPKTARRGDEIGTLAKAAETLISNMRQVISDLSSNAQTVASSATELASVSTQSANSVREMSTRTTTVAAAAEEASVNSGSVAAAMSRPPIACHRWPVRLSR